MKYIMGSIIISFGALIVVVAVLITVVEHPPENIMTYLGWAWVILAILSYPLAKKIIRE